MDTYVIEPSSSWEISKFTLNPSSIKKQTIRNDIVKHWCMIVNHKMYHYKYIAYTGYTMVDNQYFIISYPYKKYAEVCEQEFIKTLKSADLQYHRQNIMYDNQLAYKIVIADKNIDLNVILKSTTYTDDYIYDDKICII